MWKEAHTQHVRGPKEVQGKVGNLVGARPVAAEVRVSQGDLAAGVWLTSW